MDRILLAGFALCLAVFLGCLGYGLALDYSFWLDEMISVSFAQAGFGEALRLAFQDVHTPLYPAVLALWTKGFGTSELAARGLSALWAGGALACLLTLRGRFPDRQILIAMILLISHPLFFYFAQEARPYAMLLCLSTLSVCLLLRGSPWLPLAAVALGLTHYFGALLAVALLSLSWWNGPRGWRTCVVPGLVFACLVAWPVSQLLFGRLGSRLGGEHWIEAGPVESLYLAMRAVVPVVERGVFAVGLPRDLGGYIHLAFIVLGVIGIVGLAIRTPRARLSQPAMVFLAYAIVVLGASLLSFHTPVSTERNFIVLVPLAAVLGAVVSGHLLEMRRLRGGVVAALIVYVALSVLLAGVRVLDKTAPYQEWRGLFADAGAVAMETGGAIYVWIPTDGPSSNGYYERPHLFYVPADLEVRPIYRSGLAGLRPGDAVVFGNVVVTADGVTAFEEALRGAGQVFRPSRAAQTASSANGIVVILGDG
ncbi:glycosyltransferase family 39 protein [Ovoidimarina sediminis]|uniref:glycosyltransferase family 39 protein n=1 Tax=Ovoidimarina sediminis TaxID=3079856 RepID=UPI0029137C4D|nr:glycosyltransferase family 39 protein [Rhodophyticola sp. MJ-SS7]MDU8946295.1 glycosyltransferase family 39 protein [Rhodophyticola sp. MJ-SS7]